MKLLIINPGSTSTKVSLYENETELFTQSVFHDAPELLQFPTVNDQVPFRRQVTAHILARHGFTFADVDVFVGRGGSAHTQPAGVCAINDLLYRDTAQAVGGSDHPAKLGVMMAYELGCEFGKPMYTLNPTNVDELCDYARVTGIAGVYCNAQSHVLNQKATAALHAKTLGRAYEDCNFVVCHIDGGITVSAHQRGRMVDGNVGSGGDGAFTPTRLGSVPVLRLLDYLETHSIDEVRRMCSRSGGFVSHFGTSDANKVDAWARAGNPKAQLVWNAMIYQICKQVGAMSVVLEGQVDGIILTGGLVRFESIVEGIRQRCGWIAPISVYVGEVEQQAMAEAVWEVLQGRAEAHEYAGRPLWRCFGFE